MINYPFNFKKIKAIFKERVSRFVIKAIINDDRIISSYLANPGRLWELLIPNESELLLIENSYAKRLPYIVLAVKKEDKWVLLHTHLTNKIIERLIKEKLIPFYKDYQVISKEVKVDNSRFDLLLNKGKEKLYLEIKSCTLFGKKIAMFPDAVTSRGLKHLIELKKMAQKGAKTSLLFVVMSPDVEIFLPAYHIDYKFANVFLQIKESVEITAISINWDDSFSYVTNIKELNIPFLFLKRVLKDKGVYILIAKLNRAESIIIGQKGIFHFKAGYYIYVGSAKRGLFQRISRHKKKNKKKHWHIDYFLDKAKIIEDIPIITEKDLECQLAQKCEGISDDTVDKFGCSDCKCNSHLFYFKENPMFNKHFIALISYFRIDILKVQ
ncbi:MAG: DNA/RNA nuclease SfsA [Thermodesulfovibrionales bacterium]|nr:DNA/RNA nuclease SfsA [Thermodesulfovibrionales bacterium]